MSGCTYSGNGQVNGGESCDGGDLNGQSCSTLGYFAGSLGCSGSCTFDTSGCSICGDGAVGAGEACDGGNLAGHAPAAATLQF